MSKNDSCISVRTRIQFPRNHIKPDMTAHSCNSRAPKGRWETDARESLRACGSVMLAYAAAYEMAAFFKQGKTMCEVVL